MKDYLCTDDFADTEASDEELLFQLRLFFKVHEGTGQQFINILTLLNIGHAQTDRLLTLLETVDREMGEDGPTE